MIIIFFSKMKFIFLSLLVLQATFAFIGIRKSFRNPCSLSSVTNLPRGQVNIGNKVVTTDVLRNIQLENALGEKVKLGSLMGDGKSVVVFLRHLG
jgi:hypothetical protein